MEDLNDQDPVLKQSPNKRQLAGVRGPRNPVVLQKPKTAHLASKLILVTLGFSYFFFLSFSISLSPNSKCLETNRRGAEGAENTLVFQCREVPALKKFNPLRGIEGHVRHSQGSFETYALPRRG